MRVLQRNRNNSMCIQEDVSITNWTLRCPALPDTCSLATQEGQLAYLLLVWMLGSGAMEGPQQCMSQLQLQAGWVNPWCLQVFEDWVLGPLIWESKWFYWVCTWKCKFHPETPPQTCPDRMLSQISAQPVSHQMAHERDCHTSLSQRSLRGNLRRSGEVH